MCTVVPFSNFYIYASEAENAIHS